MTELQDLLGAMPDCSFEPEVTTEAIEQFRELGFANVGRITTDEEIEWLRGVYDVLMGGDVENTFLIRDVMGKAGEQRDNRVSQIIKPELSMPILRDTLFWRNSRRVAARLLGEAEQDLEAWGHMIRKSPHDDEVLAWHQDEGFWNPHFDYTSLAVWLALDPATEESGCMSFVPGSHKRGVRTHLQGGDDPSVAFLEIPDVDDSMASLQPVDVGSASVHDCRTIHKSGANRSHHVRRAYVNQWQLAPVARAEPYDRPWWHPREADMVARRDSGVRV